MRFDLAVGFRLLNRYEEAFRYLREMIANDGFPDPVWGPKDLFKADSAFQGILAEINRRNQSKRARILETEKSFSADSSKWERGGEDPPQAGDTLNVQ
jgi:hypothetical protein